MPLNLHVGCAVHLRLTPSGYVPKQLYTHLWGCAVSGSRATAWVSSCEKQLLIKGWLAFTTCQMCCLPAF
jgi:hypothetical protein